MIHHVALRQRLTAAATAIGTTVVTLALLFGLPYVLWWAAGFPWPDRVYSWSDLGDRLVQPVSDPLVTNVLAMVGWVCWAAFACSMIRETIWYTTHLPQLLRDRHAHHEHVAALSVKGSLAALCIGTLVVAVLGLWRPPMAGAQQPSSAGEVRPHIAATAPLIPAPIPQAPPSVAAARAPTHARSAGHGPVRPEPPGGSEVVRHVEYTVVEGDTLWDIAHAHMGDALTWPQIYALNKDRVQSDGARLSDPDLIMPGWRLTIPVTQNAAPPPTPPPAPRLPTPHATTAAPAETLPAQPTPHQSTGAGRHTGADHTPTPLGQRDQAMPRKTHTRPGPAGIGLGEASLIGITAAAGLLAARRSWYWHQNRLREPDLEAEVPALSTLVDRATQAAHEATLPRDTDALVTRRTPPQQPRTGDTVTIGVRDSSEIALDELAMPGGCAWTGPGAEGAARALLVGILTAAERQRPRPARVRAVVPKNLADHLVLGLPPQFTALTQSSDTAQAIQAAEQHLIVHARRQEEQGLHLAATGQVAADVAQETGLGTLVLLTVADAAHTGQLQALAARAQPGTLTILTLNTPLPGAESWHIAADGTTTRPAASEQHPSRLRLFHLTPEAGRDMTEFLLGAHGQRPRLRVLPTPGPHPHTTPAETESEAESETEPATDAAPARPNTGDMARPVQTKPVRLHVLGPITLYARGHQDPVGTNLRGEVHEFLALLAAHPAGLLASDIADKLRLETDSDQNAMKNLRRAVRRALRTATGITREEFILLHGELHKLHPELVETDLADFASGLKQAFSATGTEEWENGALSAVREALAHYRGPFAHGGDYLWADAIREHLTTQATDATLRLARHAEQAGAASRDRDGVLMLLEHLSAIHPDHERLAQHAIRLYQDAGRHDAARHTYTRLERHLAELGLEPEPATQALITSRIHSGQTR